MRRERQHRTEHTARRGTALSECDTSRLIADTSVQHVIFWRLHRERGHSVRAIGAFFGVPKSTVWRHLCEVDRHVARLRRAG